MFYKQISEEVEIQGDKYELLVRPQSNLLRYQAIKITEDKHREIKLFKSTVSLNSLTKPDKKEILDTTLGEDNYLFANQAVTPLDLFLHGKYIKEIK